MIRRTLPATRKSWMKQLKEGTVTQIKYIISDDVFGMK